MDEKEAKIRASRWDNRGIGIYCGGFLGFFFTALLTMLFGDFSTANTLLLILTGTLGGLVIGYFFPFVTETIFWVAQLFT